MNAPVGGGCACGAVRYEISGPLGFSFHCQCRKCQRATGTGHSSTFVVDINDAEITGGMRFFEQVSDSGYLTRGAFCPICVSPTPAMTDRFPDPGDDRSLPRPPPFPRRDSRRPDGVSA